MHAARFDRERVELSVRYDPARTNPDALAVLVRDGFEVKVTIGAGAGGFKAAPTYPEGSDVKVINEIGRAVASPGIEGWPEALGKRQGWRHFDTGTRRSTKTRRF